MGFGFKITDAETNRAVEGDEKDTYFRLTLAGMVSVVMPAMIETGMCVESIAPVRAEWEPGRLSADEYFACESGHHPWPKDYIELLARHGSLLPGIPEHKLLSNDDWLVTPEEIRASFASLKEYESARGRKYPPSVSEYEDLWNGWINYLARAGRLGGMAVL